MAVIKSHWPAPNIVKEKPKEDNTVIKLENEQVEDLPKVKKNYKKYNKPIKQAEK